MPQFDPDSGSICDIFVGRSRYCTCADAVNSSSIFVKEDSVSARYVGKSPVWLPYTFYTKPEKEYLLQGVQEQNENRTIDLPCP